MLEKLDNILKDNLYPIRIEVLSTDVSDVTIISFYVGNRKTQSVFLDKAFKDISKIKGEVPFITYYLKKVRYWQHVHYYKDRYSIKEKLFLFIKIKAGCLFNKIIEWLKEPVYYCSGEIRPATDTGYI